MLKDQTLHFFLPFFFFQLKPHLILKTNRHTGKGDAASTTPPPGQSQPRSPHPCKCHPAIPRLHQHIILKNKTKTTKKQHNKPNFWAPKPAGILTAVHPTALNHTVVKTAPPEEPAGSENQRSEFNQSPRDVGRSCDVCAAQQPHGPAGSVTRSSQSSWSHICPCATSLGMGFPAGVPGSSRRTSLSRRDSPWALGCCQHCSLSRFPKPRKLNLPLNIANEKMR